MVVFRLAVFIVLQILIAVLWFSHLSKSLKAADKAFWSIILALFFLPIDALAFLALSPFAEGVDGTLLFAIVGFFLSFIILGSGIILLIGVSFKLAEWFDLLVRGRGIKDLTLPGNRLIWILFFVFVLFYIFFIRPQMIFR